MKFLITILVFTTILRAQNSYESVNSDVYDFLETLSIKGLITFDYEIKPLPRIEIAKKLIEADNEILQMTELEKELLSFYIIDFKHEINLIEDDFNSDIKPEFFMGNGGDILIFDMGKPVRITNLAHDLVRLSGLIVGEDIDIITNGPRPGEKLYEELFNKDEKFNNTRSDKIFIADSAGKIIADDFVNKLNDLLEYSNSEEFDNQNCKNYLKALVPEYSPLNGNANSIQQI